MIYITDTKLSRDGGGVIGHSISELKVFGRGGLINRVCNHHVSYILRAKKLSFNIRTVQRLILGSIQEA